MRVPYHCFIGLTGAFGLSGQEHAVHCEYGGFGVPVAGGRSEESTLYAVESTERGRNTNTQRDRIN